MSIRILEQEPLAPHTMYKIGGPARFFVEVRNSKELCEALAFAAKNKFVPFAPSLNLHQKDLARSASANFSAGFFILGAGSNILVSDKGFGGVVIKIKGGEVKFDGERMIADAGVMMARAAHEAQIAGLAGFEWAIGVPGTIGGSVRGNAGCFGGEMKDVIEKVSILNFSRREVGIPTSLSEEFNEASGQFSKTEELNNQQCQFGYRYSIFKKHPEWVIISATLKLKKGDPEVIREEVKRIALNRTAKQDIGSKSCGCIFKNIPWSREDIDKNKILTRFPDMPSSGTVDGIPVSYLISQAGLKGRRAGCVFVSPKHANFFVNDGGASAEEVIMLIGIVKDAVQRKFGILLEEEIQYVGF